MKTEIEKKAETEAGQIDDIKTEDKTEEGEIIAGEGDDAADDDDPDKAKGEDEADKPFEIDLTPASHADDDEDDDEGNKTVRDMRKQLKAQNRRNRELEAKLEAKETAKVEKQLPPLGDKPTLESLDYDDEEFEKAILDYHDRKRQHDAAADKIKKNAQSQQEAYDQRLTDYSAGKKALEVDDMDEAETMVKSKIDNTQQSVLIMAAKNPAVMVLALGRSPAKLAKLSAISDPIMFAAEVARMEGSLKVTNKPKTTPEKRVQSSSAGGLSGSDAKQLERLEREADKTGDRTEVARFKRQMRDKS